MLLWGSGGKAICGVDFYDRSGRRSYAHLESFGVTGDWIIVKTTTGFYAIPQSEEGYSAGKPLSLDELQNFLSGKSLGMPKMKPI